MQDIAGCRAVPTGGQAEVEGILRRIRQTGGRTSRASRTTLKPRLRLVIEPSISSSSATGISLRSSFEHPDSTNGRKR
jgi:hypothetical protein